MICDYCMNKVKKEFEIILDKNVSGAIICKDCLDSNNPEHVELQIKWLEKRATNIKEKIEKINDKYSETLKKLDD